MGNIVVTPGTRIAIAQCPADFQASTDNTCQYRCPSGYKYSQGASGQPDRCIYETNNEHSILLQKIPVAAKPSQFDDERKRFYDELRPLQTIIDKELEVKKTFDKEVDANAIGDLRHETIQSQYAGFSSIRDAAKIIKDTGDSLKPMRSPTQPYSDIEKERRAILALTSEKLLLIQVALVTILICAAEYLVLPSEYSHKLAFITLCVGLAVGIFLTRKE